jgi:hypothetical protein
LVLPAGRGFRTTQSVVFLPLPCNNVLNRASDEADETWRDSMKLIRGAELSHNAGARYEGWGLATGERRLRFVHRTAHAGFGGCKVAIGGRFLEFGIFKVSQLGPQLWPFGPQVLQLGPQSISTMALRAPSIGIGAPSATTRAPKCLSWGPNCSTSGPECRNWGPKCYNSAPKVSQLGPQM